MEEDYSVVGESLLCNLKFNHAVIFGSNVSLILYYWGLYPIHLSAPLVLD
jgi:hypothetical protein